MNDIDDVLLQARDALSGARMEIPVEAILAKGRSRRHRRRLAQLSAAVAASGALALGLATVIGSGNPAPAPGTIRAAAFTLTRNANGTASLTLSQDQVFDPATLQQALARDGIPALVQTGTYCTSTPAPPSSGVVSLQLPDGSPVAKSTPGHQSPVPPDAVTVINPAAMPAGTELSFTYRNHDRVLTFSLIYTAAHTCSSTPPAG
ncbi:MAG: hypothetical protein WAK82_11745 [Streptosporangiaceae bacterium]